MQPAARGQLPWDEVEIHPSLVFGTVILLSRGESTLPMASRFRCATDEGCEQKSCERTLASNPLQDGQAPPFLPPLPPTG